MKKLSALLIEQVEAKKIARIDTAEEFSKYVHETMSTLPGYDIDNCNMIVENLLTENDNDIQKAIKDLANFSMHR